MLNHFTRLAAGLALALGFTACSSSKTEKPPSDAIVLFNGHDLKGWKAVTADANIPRDQVWSVKDGLITCAGTPLGFLCTEQAFTNFRLSVEYRWKPGATPGNSGVFSRINGPERPLPRCIEVQLKHGDAGDVMGLQGMEIADNQARFFHVDKHEVAGDIDGVRKLTNAEAAPGQWNRLEVQVDGAHYTVWLNGLLVNEANGVEVLAGPVGLQSEGGEIEFRRVVITPRK